MVRNVLIAALRRTRAGLFEAIKLTERHVQNMARRDMRIAQLREEIEAIDTSIALAGSPECAEFFKNQRIIDRAKTDIFEIIRIPVRNKKKSKEDENV